MKIKKIITAILTLVLSFCIFSGCGSGKKIIGVIQFGSHESLNNCYKGFLQGLKDGGLDMDMYEINFQNSNLNPSDSAAQANALKNQGAELILGIATPSAYAAISAANGEIPVVYCAVSDPVGAGFTGGAVSNVTGTSDLLNFDGQLKMIRAFIPDASKIGVLYSIKEANSLSQIKTLKETAAQYGFEVIEKSFNETNEVLSAIQDLLSRDLDCITNLTDNTVCDAFINDFISEAGKKGIPIFGSEIEQVRKGCLASESLDYVELGRQTGLIASQILKGEKTADEIEYLKIQDSFPCYNSEALKKFNMSLPEQYKDILDVKGEN